MRNLRMKRIILVQSESCHRLYVYNLSANLEDDLINLVALSTSSSSMECFHRNMIMQNKLQGRFTVLEIFAVEVAFRRYTFDYNEVLSYRYWAVDGRHVLHDV